MLTDRLSKGYHAIAICVHLGIHGMCTRDCIAEYLGISGDYVTALLRPLRLGGFVEIARGANGGAWLPDHARKRTAGDVLHAVGLDLRPKEPEMLGAPESKGMRAAGWAYYKATLATDKALRGFRLGNMIEAAQRGEIALTR